MSRIGKKPITIPSAVQVDVQGTTARVKGPKGELSLTIDPCIQAVAEGNVLTVTRANDGRKSRSLHGLYRSLIANMIEGVEKGYSRDLEIEGVGFKAELKGKTLFVHAGFASPKEFLVPDGVDVTIDGGTRVKVSSIDKQKVGQAAARIRSFAPAEPYKGKGIKYAGERIRRKEGKTVA
jgi:large subunit ribosomal protein L6